MNRYLKTLLYVFLIFIPLFFVYASFFKGLRLVWGDAPYYFPDAFKDIFGGLPIWGRNGIDFGGRTLALWLSPIMVLYGSLNKYLGLGNDAIIRIVFYFPAVIFALSGPYLLARYLKFSGKVQFFSSFIYLFNTYFLMLIDGGQVGIALAYGFFPFTLLFWIKFFDAVSVKNFLAAILMSLILCLMDPRIAAISFVFLFLWLVLKGITEKSVLPIKHLVWLIAGGLLMIPLNLFWILPVIKGGFTGIESAVSDLQLSSILNSLLLFAPSWPFNLYGKITAPYFYFILVPVFIFGGFLFRKNIKKFYIFAFIFLFFAFIAKGTTPPLGKIYEYLIGKIPFGSVFRDSSKFFIPLMLTAGILIGNTVEGILGRFRNKYLRVFVFGIFYFYFVLLLNPALRNKLNFNLSGRSESADYQVIADRLKNDGESFNTIWFNEKPQIAYGTDKKPALSANQLVSFRVFAALNVGEDAYNFLNNPAYVNLFKILGIKYIVMPGDARNIHPSEQDSKNWAEENKLVSKTPNLFKQDWGIQTPVYKIENVRPEMYSVPKIYLVVGHDLEPVENMPVVAYAEDGKTKPEVLENVDSDSLGVYFNGGDGTDLAMSFLQRYFKSPFEGVSEWSNFHSSSYLKYKYELLMRNYKFNDFDFGRGIAFSSVNGEKIKYFFNIPGDGNYVIAKRTGNLQKQKLFWDFETKTLKKGVFEYEIENTSGLTVLNVVAAVPEGVYKDSVKKSESFISKFGVSTNLRMKSAGWHPVNKNINTNEYGIPDNDNWLIYTQNYDRDWTISTSGINIPAFSMINSFYLNGKVSATIGFNGQKFMDLGIKISFASLLLILAAYLLSLTYKKP